MTATAAALTPAADRTRLGLAAMAVMAFTVVTSETVPVGLLREIARGVDSTDTAVGSLVTWYAVVAGVTALPAVRLTAAMDRGRVLAGSAVVFAVGNLGSALATTMPLLIASRAVAATAHGLFFAVALATAARLATPDRRGRATGLVVVGSSSAFVLGVPAATALGQLAGWRMVFALMAALSAVLAAACLRLVPPVPGVRSAADREAAGVKAILRVRPFLVIQAVTLLLVIAHFATFTYIAPYLADSVGISSSRLALVLLVYGIAAVAGSASSSRLADRWPFATTAVGGAALVFGFLLLRAAAEAPVLVLPAVLVWGGAFSMLVVSTQLAGLHRVMGPGADTASALRGNVFQIGIVAGSGGGTALVGRGFLDDLPLGAMAFAGLALLLVLAGARSFRGPGQVPLDTGVPSPARSHTVPARSG